MTQGTRTTRKAGGTKRNATTSKARAKKSGTTQSKATKRVSAIDAAAKVLAKAKTPMRCSDLITAMAERGLWTSPNGQTPAATLYSAILREINVKKSDSRFKKVDRGQFAFNGKRSK
jgi:hypothetical protein